MCLHCLATDHLPSHPTRQGSIYGISSPCSQSQGREPLLWASPSVNLKEAGALTMHLLLLQLLVLLPLGKAAWPEDGGQSQSSVPPVLLLERSPRELPLGNHGEAEEKPDLFVALPHLVGASISGGGQWQREKMLFRFGRFWKKPERELHPTQDPFSEHSPPVTQALPQSKDGLQIKKSPLQEEAKKFWHRFMFRMSPASQGVILPIKSHEVHQETCRTLPFSQVSVLGGRGRVDQGVQKEGGQLGQMGRRERRVSLT